jgi:predicted porin
MKLKTSAIALAVAGTLGASMAAQADSGFYGSVRIGLQYLDTVNPNTLVSDDQTTVRGFGSRFGFRGETDMGNGLTGFGRYEFGVATEGTGPNVTRRHAYVGMKGDWGSVLLGQTYHTWYNFMNGPIDNPWWGAAYSWLGYAGRTAQGITYAGDWGMFSAGTTLYMNNASTSATGGHESLDSYDVAGAFDFGKGGKLALGLMNTGTNGGVDGEDITGVTYSGLTFGIVTLGAAYSQQKNVAAIGGTSNSIVVDVLIGPGYVHYEQFDTDVAAGPTPTSITLGYTQSIGRQTTMWYEYQAFDADIAAAPQLDADIVRAVLKYDWK